MAEIVTPENLDEVILHLGLQEYIGFDTETTGTSIEDRIFSLALATKERTFYFNFYSGVDHLDGRSRVVHNKEILKYLPWAGKHFAHNAKFDFAMLGKEVCNYVDKVDIECTMVNERLLRNDFPSPKDYSLENTALRYGLKKDMSIDAYIKEHNLYRDVIFDGEVIDKVPMYYMVPFDRMVAYAGLDARLALEIGLRQNERFVASKTD